MRGTATSVHMDTLVRIGGGQLVPRAATLFVVSGVVFGAAMVGVGGQVLAATRRGGLSMEVVLTHRLR
jgi:hypothetical protein